MSPQTVNFYDATYRRFGDPVYREIRRATWGEDIGQNGWITAAEQDRFLQALSIGPGKQVLDVACGSGGPTLRIAERTGAAVVGIDIHADGVEAGRQEARARGLSQQVSFEVVDAAHRLPFPDGRFDAVVCVDAINHLPDRTRTLADWARVLRPGGRLLFTDPLVVTGPLTSDEIAVRASIGFFLFVAHDTNELALTDVRLDLLLREDLSEALALTAARWQSARRDRTDLLRSLEGEATFEGQQRFLEVASRLAAERRLSRVLYLAGKPG